MKTKSELEESSGVLALYQVVVTAFLAWKGNF